MNVNKTIYWVSTALLSLFFLAGAAMYFVAHDRATGFFVSLGFPTWLIYPLAVAKILGVVAVLSRASGFLKELAYAGFLYDAMLALAAHVAVADGEYAPALVALVLISTSWVFERRLFGSLRQTVVRQGDESLAGSERIPVTV